MKDLESYSAGSLNLFECLKKHIYLKYLKYLSSTYLGLSIWRYSNIQMNWREKSTMIMFQEENNYINVAMKSQFL